MVSEIGSSAGVVGRKIGFKILGGNEIDSTRMEVWLELEGYNTTKVNDPNDGETTRDLGGAPKQAVVLPKNGLVCSKSNRLASHPFCQ